MSKEPWKDAFEAEQKIKDLANAISNVIGPEETAWLLREIADELEGEANGG